MTEVRGRKPAFQYVGPDVECAGVTGGKPGVITYTSV